MELRIRVLNSLPPQSWLD